MRRLIFLSLAAAPAIACGRYGYEARTTTITGAPMITSGPAVGELELPRTLRATSERLADEVCAHQQRCGHSSASACLSATRPAVCAELASWNCEPAAIRARLEECLAGFRAATCELDLSKQDRVCPDNLACGEPAARLISPGPILAQVWRD